MNILVCDDEPNIRRLLEVLFVRAGHVVFTARDGCEAIKEIRTKKPDLVVLDVILPAMSGYDVLDHVRRDSAVCDTFIVMLSALTRDSDVYQAYHRGADAFLTKPFNPRELTALLKK